MSRKKYDTQGILTNDKSVLKRGTANKEQLINKLRKLEVELGSYSVKDKICNQETLALYITPNPRDMHKAGLKTIRELAGLLEDGKRIYNPESIALNMIQVSARKVFMDIDIDVYPSWLEAKETFKEDIIDLDFINEDVLTFIDTRGGYHLLVELDRIKEKYKKTWYQKISSFKHEGFQIMMNGDNMIPCPGCVQSDYIPKLIK